MVLEQFIIDADIIWDQVGKTFFENPEAKPGRIMRVQVVNAGIIEDLTGYTLNLGWTSVRDPSKFGLDAFDDVDITKGIFEIEYTSGMLKNIGPLNASLQLVPPGEGRPIESNNFKLTVKNSAINPDAIQGETSFKALENALVEVNGWNTTIDGKVVAWEADMAATKQLYIDNMEEVEATYPQELNSLSQQLAEKADLSEVANGLTAKGSSVYASLPTTGNSVGDYYYCSDGNGIDPAGNYVWNGTTWYFGGTGDDGYNQLNATLVDLRNAVGQSNLSNFSESDILVINDVPHTVTSNSIAIDNAGGINVLIRIKLPQLISGHVYTFKANVNGFSAITINRYASPATSGQVYQTVTNGECIFTGVSDTLALIGTVPYTYKSIATISNIELIDTNADLPIKDGAVTTAKIADKAVTQDKIAAGAVEFDTLNGVSKVRRDGTNFLDKNELVNGKYLSSGSPATYTSNSSLSVTGKIPLKSNTQYYFRYMYPSYYAFYDSTDTLLQYVGSEGGSSGQIGFKTTPQNTAYGIFTIVTTSVPAAYIWTNYTECSLKESEYYSEYAGEVSFGNDEQYACGFTGRDITLFNKGLCIGDSLTEGVFNTTLPSATWITDTKYSYPAYLAKLTNIPVTNLGNGGYTSDGWYSLHQSDDLSGYDFAIIQLGVNDATYNGWTATSKTAFTNIINKLKAENNNIKIFVSTIIPASAYFSVVRQTISQGIRDLVAEINDENVILLDMALYAHTMDEDAYNAGHLTAYGYYRLAQDYHNYISWYVNKHKDTFKQVQFIGTDYSY